VSHRDAGHVHEHAAGKPLVQPIVEPARVSGRVPASVADEYLACGHASHLRREELRSRWRRISLIFLGMRRGVPKFLAILGVMARRVRTTERGHRTSINGAEFFPLVPEN